MTNQRTVPSGATRAYSVLEVKSVNEDEMVIRGVATTPSADRVGDVVEPLGVSFKNPMPLLWQHQHDKPVGTVKFDKPTKDGITFEAKLAKVTDPGILKDRIDEAWQSVKAGLVRAVSIGFRALEYAFTDEGIHFLKTEVIELSLVTIPANQDATITTIKSIAEEQRAASGTEAQPSGEGAPRRVRRTETPARRKKMARKSYAERIAAFDETLKAKRAEMVEIMDEAEEEGRTLSAEEKDAYDGLEAEVGELREHIKRLTVLQADEAKKAKEVDGSPRDVSVTERAVVHAQVKAPKSEPGIRMARYIRSIYLAKSGNRDIMSVAQEEYGQRDPSIVDMVKAAVIASNTTTDAALIGNEGGWADFVEYLRPQTIVGRFGSGDIPGLTRVPFRVPLITEATESAAYWVGEGKPKPLTKATWTRTEMSPLKVATIAVATMEQLRDSSPAAEGLIRASLTAAVAKRIDQSFIDPTNSGSAGVSPAGILNGVAALTSSGNDADAIRADVAAVMGAFAAANNPLTSGVWIMSASRALYLSLMVNALGQPEFPGLTMRGGTFMGLPVLVSNYTSGDIVALVNAGDIYLADEGGVAVDMSTEASLQMMDNPTNDVISTTPVATDLVSLWQTNSVGFRAERTLNWMRRRTSAVAWLDSVDWGEDSLATS